MMKQMIDFRFWRVVVLVVGVCGWSGVGAQEVESDSLFKTYLKLRDESKCKEAIPYAEKILEILEIELGVAHEAYISICRDIALFYKCIGDDDKAIPYLIQFLGGLKWSTSDYVSGFYTLIGVYANKDRYDEIITLYEKLVADIENDLKWSDNEHSKYLAELQYYYTKVEKYDRALAINIMLLDIAKRLNGESHVEYVGYLGNIAILSKTIGDFDAALAAYSKVRDFWATKNGKNDLKFFQASINLANLIDEIEGPTKSIVLYEDILTMLRDSESVKSAEYFECVFRLALAYERKQMYDKALPILLEVIDFFDSETKKNPDYLFLLKRIVWICNSLKEYEQAMVYSRIALEYAEKEMGQSSAEYVSLLMENAGFQIKYGDKEVAIGLYMDAIRIMESNIEEYYSEYCDALNILAVQYRYMGRHKEAFSLLEEAMKIQEKTIGTSHHDYYTTLGNIAGLYKQVDKLEEASSLYKTLLDGINPETPGYDIHINNIANHFIAIGKYSEALPLLNAALHYAEVTFGVNHHFYIERLSNIGVLYEKIGDYSRALFF
jgi:tetratricopeptide (TPR) repeat protein